MNEKTKVGLFLLVGDSWWGAGVSDAKEGSFVGFLGKVKADASAVTRELEKHFEVVSSGLLHTREQAVTEARNFNAEDVDAVVFCPIIWTNRNVASRQRSCQRTAIFKHIQTLQLGL